VEALDGVGGGVGVRGGGVANAYNGVLGGVINDGGDAGGAAASVNGTRLARLAAVGRACLAVLLSGNFRQTLWNVCTRSSSVG
jgi:hypothetical protein